MESKTEKVIEAIAKIKALPPEKQEKVFSFIENNLHKPAAAAEFRACCREKQKALPVRQH